MNKQVVKIERRIELEDIVLNQNNWKKLTKLAPCYFKAPYGKIMWIGTEKDMFPLECSKYIELRKFKLGVRD